MQEQYEQITQKVLDRLKDEGYRYLTTSHFLKPEAFGLSTSGDIVLIGIVAHRRMPDVL